MIFSNTISRLVSLVRPKKVRPPTVTAVRNSGSEAAVVFVHGFTGNVSTWDQFIQHFLGDSSVSSWDVYTVTYPSTLVVDIPVWEAEPPLATLARELTTVAGDLLPLARYPRLSLVAHSMGGLVVQRAILDHDLLRSRLSYVMLFGTPSNGLAKASFVSVLKRQLRDMGAGSEFIKGLRDDWVSKVGERPPFSFYAIQGDTDAFVPPESSLAPFPDMCRRVISGNHLQIVRPSDSNHPGFQLVAQALSGRRPARPAVDGARLAVELGQFREAISTLSPNAEGLDDAAKVTLALALDGTGRTDEALKFLEESGNRSCPEALGVLAGRHKRTWLRDRQSINLDQATSLYSKGLEIAELSGDHSQCYYHAINLAFLYLVSGVKNSAANETSKHMAQKALHHCDKASVTNWSLATRGEANLILNQPEQALAAYRDAIANTASPRERDSMYLQATAIAMFFANKELAHGIDKIFGAT